MAAAAGDAREVTETGEEGPATPEPYSRPHRGRTFRGKWERWPETRENQERSAAPKPKRVLFKGAHCPVGTRGQEHHGVCHWTVTTEPPASQRGQTPGGDQSGPHTGPRTARVRVRRGAERRGSLR